MAWAVCPLLSPTLPNTSIVSKQFGATSLTGAGRVSAGGWSSNWGLYVQPLVQRSSRSQPYIVCRSFDEGKLAEARKYQLQATEVLAELLKSSNTQATAQKYLDFLTEEFFMVASTYLEMAKKEGNVEVLKKLETVLEIAMTEKGKTLRPEIQLMNKLLNETNQKERAKTIQSNLLYMDPDGYFFELLQRMMADVEALKDSPKKKMLLTQIRTVSKETKEAARSSWRTN